MYCDYFGFKQEPFTIAPDPAFLYPSSQHRQALAHLKYGLEREGGFILLTGEVGTGKTTLTRLLLQQMPGAFRVAYVLNAKLDTLDVLASICDELHIALPGNSNRTPKTYIDALNENLLRAHAEGLKTLVVIEEAQNLDEAVLEMLRLLTNLETNTSKLLHILLVGQPELLELIGRPQLRQLNQRVVSRFHLQPLDRAETENYLRHRMRKAGCGRVIFDRGALDAMQKLSQGVPRKLNLLAERALLGAYSKDRARVGKTEVMQAEKEVFGTPRTSRTSFYPWQIAGVALLLSLILLFWAQQISQSQDLPNARVIEQLEPVLQPLPSRDELEVSLQTDEQALPQPPDIPEPVEVVELVRNPFEELLLAWGIDASSGSIEELCITAAQKHLRCEVIDPVQAKELLSVNRPMLLNLDNSQWTPGPYLLKNFQNELFELTSGQSSIYLNADQIEQAAVGTALYLWQPPLGYADSVRLGDSNWPLINWLQPRLVDINPDLANLITGGHYTQPIFDAVKQYQADHGLVKDGVLGRQTLMKLNEADALVPLLMERN